MPFGGNGCDINLISLGDHDGREIEERNITKKKKNKHDFIWDCYFYLKYSGYLLILLMYRNLSIQLTQRMPT